MILWSEPAGGGGQPSGPRRSHYTVGWLRERVYSEIRRFIVIVNHGHHSLCIPIQTYGGQGANKRDVIIKNHTRIYTEWPGSPEPPCIGNEEKFMNKRSIRMVPMNQNPQNETLDPASRINFGKSYTVEHNVRVLGIGKIHDDDEHMLMHYYKDVHELP